MKRDTPCSQQLLLQLLYPSILVPLYSDWITSIDLCYLDTAVCCTTLRNTFLFQLRMCQVSYSDEQFEYDWLVMRGMRLSSLILNTVDEQSEDVFQLVRSSRHLNSLSIPCTDEAVDLCLKYVEEVDELSFVVATDQKW